MSLFMHEKKQDLGTFLKIGKEMPSPNGILINKGWPLKKLFNDQITIMRDIGQLQKALIPVKSKTTKRKTENETDGIHIKEVFSIFGLLGIIIFISLAIFSIEILTNQYMLQ